MSDSPTPDAIARDFERVVDHLGHVPSQAEYSEYGEFAWLRLVNAFAPADDLTYPAAVQELGYTLADPESSPSGTITPAAVEQDFERVVAALGHVPTTAEYNEHGAYSAPTVGAKLTEGDSQSYNQAVKNLGYTPPNEVPTKTPTDELRQDFRRVVEQLEHVPSSTEYNKHGSFTARTLVNRFSDTGSYDDAVETLGYTPRP